MSRRINPTTLSIGFIQHKTKHFLICLDQLPENGYMQTKMQTKLLNEIDLHSRHDTFVSILHEKLTPMKA
jgi:hypothetical protein